MTIIVSYSYPSLREAIILTRYAKGEVVYLPRTALNNNDVIFIFKTLQIFFLKVRFEIIQSLMKKKPGIHVISIPNISP